MNTTKGYWKLNEEWLSACKDEFRGTYGTKFDDARLIEFTDDGAAYVHYEGGTYPLVFKGAVTPLSDF